MKASTQPVQKSAIDALDEQEFAFVCKLTEIPRSLTIGECGAAVGYDEMYAYRKARSPKIRAAIDQIVDERSGEFTLQTYRVLRVMGQEAEKGEVDAAKVYLDAMGRGNSGVRIVNNVTANATQADPLEERIRSRFERVKAGVSNDS